MSRIATHTARRSVGPDPVPDRVGRPRRRPRQDSPARTRGGRPTAAVVAASLLGATALLGCGIAPEDEAQEMRATDVPFGLLDAERTTSTAPVDVGGVGEIYLVAGGQLVAAARPMAPDMDLDDVIEVLAAGPSRDEASIGLGSALPQEPTVRDVSLARSTATVELDPAFTELRPADQPMAIAQMVFTLTRRPGVERVAFTLEGEPLEVPRGDGTLTTDPLVRSDFPTLRGLSPTTTTTTTPITTTTVPALPADPLPGGG